MTYSLDLNALTNARQDLLVGLLDTNSEGNGFDTLDFEITREGVKVVDQTFNALADATAFFENNTLNLGSNGAGNVVGNLDLIFSLTLTTNDVGAGYAFDLVFGNSTLNSGFPRGDFDQNGIYNCADIDALVAVIAAGSHTMSFDLNGDNLVTTSDLDAWRLEAGNANIGPGRAYLIGDANLDGFVDGSDFGIWNTNKFTLGAAWCRGDFNASGVIDGSDFGLWNAFKFTSSDSSIVPEPIGITNLVLLISLALSRGRKSRR